MARTCQTAYPLSVSFSMTQGRKEGRKKKFDRVRDWPFKFNAFDNFVIYVSRN